MLDARILGMMLVPNGSDGAAVHCDNLAQVRLELMALVDCDAASDKAHLGEFLARRRFDLATIHNLRPTGRHAGSPAAEALKCAGDCLLTVQLDQVRAREG